MENLSLFPTYRKPVYDPFEVFRPTKTFILEQIKFLKQECYEIIKEKREVQQTGPEGFWDHYLEQLDARHKRLLSRIKHYECRLRGNQGYGSHNAGERKIDNSDIERAKQHPIRDLYDFQGRLQPGRLLARCPFHPDKTPSFIIDKNNRFHCFGCGADGDSIEFIMRLNNLKFIEAVRYLCSQT